MATSTKQSGARKGEKARTACYVYGVVQGGVEVVAGATGVGDPPAKVSLIKRGDIGALVSEVEVDRPLGRPEDLMAHERVLDATITAAPVLPMRFGAVVTTPQAVAEELLDAHHDELVAALDEIDGRAEYIVKGRYVEEALLTEVLSENPTAAKLRDQLRGLTETEGRNARIQLGEIISQAVESQRDADTRAMIDALAGISEAAAVRPPTHELDAVHVAVLIETDREGELERVLDGLAGGWSARVTLALRGPLAPYDFVVTPQPHASVG